MATSIPYTILRNGIYWLNIRWQDTHLRTTLRTREPSKAMALVGSLIEQLETLRDHKLDIDHIKQAVRQWLHTQTNQLEMTASLAGYFGHHPLKIGNMTYQAFMSGAGKDLEKAQGILDKGYFQRLDDEAERFAKEHLNGSVEGREKAFLCRELALAKRELGRRITEHDYSDRLAAPLPVKPSIIESAFNMSVGWEKYIEESVAQGKLKERSEVTYRQYFARFIDIVGDIPFSSFTKEVARNYKEELMDYPAYRSATAERKKMTYQEVKLVVSKRLSISSISSDMSAISGFFNWAVNQGYTDCNHLESMIIPRDSDEEERDQFNNEDLLRIFSSPVFQGVKSEGHHSR